MVCIAKTEIELLGRKIEVYVDEQNLPRGIRQIVYARFKKPKQPLRRKI